MDKGKHIFLRFARVVVGIVNANPERYRKTHWTTTYEVTGGKCSSNEKLVTRWQIDPDTWKACVSTFEETRRALKELYNQYPDFAWMSLRDKDSDNQIESAVSEELSLVIANGLNNCDSSGSPQDAICNEFENWLQLKRLPGNGLIVWSPLLGFDSDAEEILLDDDIVIRKWRDEEKSKFLSSQPSTIFQSSNIEWHTMLTCKYLLVRNSVPSPSAECEIRIEDRGEKTVVTAIRLLCDGIQGFPWIVHDSARPYARRFPHFTSTNGAIPWHLGRIGFLPKSRIGELKDVIRMLRDTESNQAISRSLTRFYMAQNRISSEDVLIDLTVSLECLLLNGQKTEQRKTFSQRAAWFETKANARERQFEVFRALYDLRSAIVHGGHLLSAPTPEMSKLVARIGDSLTLAEFPKVAMHMSKAILLGYMRQVSNGKTIDKINDELDRKALGLTSSDRLSDQ